MILTMPLDIYRFTEAPSFTAVANARRSSADEIPRLPVSPSLPACVNVTVALSPDKLLTERFAERESVEVFSSTEIRTCETVAEPFPEAVSTFAHDASERTSQSPEERTLTETCPPRASISRVRGVTSKDFSSGVFSFPQDAAISTKVNVNADMMFLIFILLSVTVLPARVLRQCSSCQSALILRNRP